MKDPKNSSNLKSLPSITMRRYRVWWTTLPECIGFSTSPEKTKAVWDSILAGKPNIISTAKTCIDTMKEMQLTLPKGVFLAKKIFRAADGVEVNWSELVRDMMECQKLEPKKYPKRYL